MTRVVHLVIGPEEHGVVRHGLLLAGACGDAVVRAETVDDLGALPPCDVVHVPFTDRLFGRTADAAGVTFRRVARLIAARGAALSVTLHDLPHDDSVLQRRRRALYQEVMRAARGVVVNSATELRLVQDDADDVHSLRMIPLPVENLGPSDGSAPLPERCVTVLGFVFPDRGHDEVIAALPDDCTFAVVGRPSDGHEDLIDRYRTLAGGRWHLTGFVPDSRLRAQLESAAVPVAPNRRVTASASINTWLSCGRRPLVPDSPYARELAEDRPGAITIYDPDDPEALQRAIEHAVAHPGSTRLADDVDRGPCVATVARLYRSHLASCVPPRAHQVDGRVVVPGNRWDLVDLDDGTAPRTVTVIVPYYRAQRALDLVLAGLSVQTYPQELLEIVVVDDGSPTAPDVRAADGIDTRVLRQPDEGFRAARARNLGAAAARGDILLFLDGDTVPEPDYVANLVALPSRCDDVLAVGRRRHADLTGLDVAGVRRWRDHPVDVPELAEPAWLRDAYADSGDLLRADRRSYRYVLSAVIGLSARLFRDVGGFDERFTAYGGEDWEFAHRARNAGAVLAHVRRAVAWHDGTDWAGRDDDRTRAAVKNLETLTLAHLLPDPQARGGGQWSPYPSIVVRAAAMSAEHALATVRSAFAAGADCAFWFDAIEGSGADLVLQLAGVATGAPPDDVLARAWCHARVHGPADLRELGALAQQADVHGEVHTPAVQLYSARSIARVCRLNGQDSDMCRAVLFGRHQRADPVLRRDIDLAGELRATAPAQTDRHGECAARTAGTPDGPR